MSYVANVIAVMKERINFGESYGIRFHSSSLHRFHTMRDGQETVEKESGAAQN